MTKEKLTFGSLFAGIGGFDLGFERAGMVCKWQVEIDDYANAILKRHWPQARRFKDVTEFAVDSVDGLGVDVICGGFPCQPHSVAGKRLGSDDERDLWGEFARVIRVLRPKFVVAENVPGLLTSDNGRFFGRVLRDLAACGLDAEWEVLSACAFGAAHSRQRLFIVAHPNGNGLQGFFGQLEKKRKQCELLASRYTSERLEGYKLPSPVFCRSADGIPNRTQRTKTLGNAVVPRVANAIAEALLEITK